MKRSSLRNLAIAGVAVMAAAATFSNTGAQAQAGRKMPVFEVDASWPKLPNNWLMGHVASVGVDSRDHVFLLHRPNTIPEDKRKNAAPPVLEFDEKGQYVNAWGGPGTGYDWPDSEHGIAVDYKNNIWIGGSAPVAPSLRNLDDDMLLKFDNKGKFLLQIGGRSVSKGNADTKSVHQSADVFVWPKTNEAFVADGYGNHRVIVLNADTGAFKRMWGAFGNKPVDDDHCEVVTPKAFPAGPGPQNFSIVHALRVAKDGTVYVADRENRRVQSFTTDGKFLKQIVKTDTPFARDLALSPDPAQQFLYVGNGEDIVIVDRKAMAIVGSIKVPGMIGGGHHIATDSKGNIYIAATGMGLQKLAIR